VLRSLVRALARRLPAARGEALIAGGRAGFTLLTGRPTRGGRGRAKTKAAQAPSDRARAKRGDATATEGQAKSTSATGTGPDQLTDAIRADIQRAERALQDGRFDEAAAISGRLAQQLPANRRVLELHAATLAGGDDAQAHAVALHRLHVLRDDPDVRLRERVAAGRVAMLSPQWLPRLPGKPAPIVPSGSEAVLIVVEESLPYRATPLTERLQARLGDLTAAGFRPEVVTALGFPRSAGVTDVSSVEAHDGIPHHRLDLGAFYPLDGPPDRRLLDAAWLAAGVAGRVRPARIHVLLDGEGIEAALLGAALAGHFGLPLILEIVADTGRATGDAERMRAGVTRVMELADRVITADQTTRDRVVARGLDPQKVTVVPIDAGSASNGADIRTAYAGVATRTGRGIRA
jgi:hypothetical protein